MVPVPGDAPTLTSAIATAPTIVDLTFDEALDHDAAADTQNYVIVPGYDPTKQLQVLGIDVAADGATVRLYTDVQRGQAQYTLTLDGVVDVHGTAISDTSSQTTFAGFGPSPDAAWPVGLSPTDTTTLPLHAGDAVHLVWTERLGAQAYRIEIASDPLFQNIVATLTTTSETTVDFVPTDALTYYWRIIADTTDVSTTAPASSFSVLFDTVYVHCPAGTTCDAFAGNGTKNVPAQTFNRAIIIGTQVAATRIDIAARGDGSAYAEHIYLVGHSFDFFGGYDSSFTESARSPTLNVTQLAEHGTVLVISTPGRPTRIDGLTIAATLNPNVAADGQVLTAAELVSLDADFEMHDVDLSTDGGAQQVHALFIAGTSNGATFTLSGASRVTTGSIFAFGATAVIDGATIAAGNPLLTSGDRSTPAIEALACTTTVRHATLSSPPSNKAAVVTAIAGSLDLSDSVVTLDGTAYAGDGYGVWVDYQSSGNTMVASIQRNIIQGRGNIGTMYGVIFRPTQGLLANNIIVAAGTSGASATVLVGLPTNAQADIVYNVLGVDGPGVVLDVTGHDNPSTPQYVGQPRVTDNLIVGTNVSSVGGKGVPEAVASLQNNLFFGFGTCVWNNSGCAATVPTSATSSIDHNQVSGLSIAQAFVNAGGSDGLLSTVLDDDLHLASAAIAANLATAGKPATNGDCGTQASPHDCGDVTDDFTGAARDATPTPGPYETNP